MRIRIRLRVKGQVPVALLGVAVALVSLLPASTALAAGTAGWGRPTSFVGRYDVRILDAGASHAKGGELTMFMQEEFPGSKQPAGILKLRLGGGRNDLVYLTSLHHRGSGRGAEIRGGAFVGPKIGSFRGEAIRPGKIRATFATRGLGTVRASFVRFSKSPTP